MRQWCAAPMCALQFQRFQTRVCVSRTVFKCARVPATYAAFVRTAYTNARAYVRPSLNARASSYPVQMRVRSSGASCVISRPCYSFRVGPHSNARTRHLVCYSTNPCCARTKTRLGTHTSAPDLPPPNSQPAYSPLRWAQTFWSTGLNERASRTCWK